MGEGIHTLYPSEEQYQPYNKSHTGNQAISDEMQRQMNMCNAPTGLLGDKPLTYPSEEQYQPYNKSHTGNQAISDKMQRQMNMCNAPTGLLGDKPRQMNMCNAPTGLLGDKPLRGGGGGGGGSMMPSHMKPSPSCINRNDGRNYGGGSSRYLGGGGGGMMSYHMKPSPSRNYRNVGWNYDGGSSRYLDNESMENIKQFDNYDRSSHQHGGNFNFSRLGPRVEDDLGGPVGRGNDYNRIRQKKYLDPIEKKQLNRIKMLKRDYRKAYSTEKKTIIENKILESEKELVKIRQKNKLESEKDAIECMKENP